MDNRENILVENFHSFNYKYLIGKIFRIMTKRGVIGPPNRKFSTCNEAEINTETYTLDIDWDSGITESYKPPFTIQIHGYCNYDDSEFSLFLNEFLKKKSKVLATNRKKGLFILLIGLPGSGKSTLSKELSLRLGAIHIDYAIICRTYFNYWPTNKNDYSLCGKHVNKYVTGALTENKIIVYDTTALTKKERNFFHGFAKITNSNYVEVYKNTRTEICRKRLLEERADTCPDLRLNLDYKNDKDYILSFEQLECLFEKPSSSINGNAMIDELIKKLKEYIL